MIRDEKSPSQSRNEFDIDILEDNTTHHHTGRVLRQRNDINGDLSGNCRRTYRQQHRPSRTNPTQPDNDNFPIVVIRQIGRSEQSQHNTQCQEWKFLTCVEEHLRVEDCVDDARKRPE